MEKSCAACGIQFVANQARVKACSEACRERLRWWASREHPPYSHTCEQCESEYEASKATQRYCSTYCRNRSGMPLCTVCGTPSAGEMCRPCLLMAKAGRTHQRTCPDCGGACSGETCRPCRNKRQVIRDASDKRVIRKHRESAAPGIRPFERNALLVKWKRQGRTCAYCARLADTVDHVVPLVRGGTNYEGNLVPACKSCNSSKGGRTVMEWRTGRRATRMSKALAWTS